ncbi:MAG TPA: glycosyltransferase family 1 protein, partial [Proteobacteria bacterium]|nr:glycosyltransferase family 1 protein [Pseudomonadota bacterium]
MTHKKIKIFVLGLRGFPNVPGGVEKHCEELYTRLVKLGCEVTVITRAPYIPRARRYSEWRGVKFIHLSARRNKHLETIIHTFWGTIVAARHRPDIIHLHAIGPSIFSPLAKILGMKVVVTNHGPDYLRQKWGKPARFILSLGEMMGTRFADRVIVISTGIKEMLEKKYGRRDLRLIPNGVVIPEQILPGKILERFGLQPGKYVLSACRFVPEKGLLDLIAAYQLLKKPEYKLVLAGGADHENETSRDIQAAALRDTRIILPGYLTGLPLAELFSSAGLFVLPSYHEGLPIALLEAMSYRLPVLVSDIAPNREVPLPEERYFPAGDIDSLSRKLSELFQEGISRKEMEAQQALLVRKYDWEQIARRTM